MASTFVIVLEASFFIISLFASALAIFMLRKARKALSDDLLKKAISWMIYASFLLAFISLLVGFNFLISVNPDAAALLDDYNYVTITNIVIWATIACNIMIATLIGKVGKTFGFKDTGEKDSFFERILLGKK